MSAQVRGDRLFCLERPTGAEQFVLTLRSAVDPDVEANLLVDPAVGTADSANAIDWFEASPDGSLVAVGTSEGGSEHSVLRVLASDDGHDLGEAIPDTRACSVAWEPDSSGFAYTRYPEGDQYHRTVHHHVIGDRWQDDPVVWAEHPDPQAWPDVTMSPDGRWLLVHVLVGWARIDVHLLDRSTVAWRTVVEGVEATSQFEFSGDGKSLVGVTTVEAPRGRVVRTPLDGPGDWETIVAEGDAVLSHPVVSSDGLLVVSTSRAVDAIRRYDADGRPLGTVEGIGDVVAVAGLTADRDTGVAFAVVDSFAAPTALWRVDGDPRPWSTGPAGAAVPSLSVSQVTYPSPDGTSIGLFLIHRDDVTPAPDVPAILNGYGGFAIAETPVWSPQIAAWCAAGGLYAIAGLRGGLEEGEAWHHAGRRDTKQNVFDDFHAAADWLVGEGLAGRDRLAVLGRSNGGLLVGVAMTQRPDLCRAVWCGVPLLDMIRFPEFLIARLWTSEYGDPAVAGGVRLAARLLPLPPRRRRRGLSGDAVHHGRGRQPGRPSARPQDGRAGAVRVIGPGRAAGVAVPGGPRRPRRRQARRQTGRRAGGRADVPRLADRPAAGVTVPRRVADRGGCRRAMGAARPGRHRRDDPAVRHRHPHRRLAGARAQTMGAVRPHRWCP